MCKRIERNSMQIIHREENSLREEASEGQMTEGELTEYDVIHR